MDSGASRGSKVPGVDVEDGDGEEDPESLESGDPGRGETRDDDGESFRGGREGTPFL